MSFAPLREHPVAIHQWLDAQFPAEQWLAWEPETLVSQLPEVGDGPAQDKVLGVQAAAANSGVACTHAAAFEKVVHAFCNNAVVPGVVQLPEVAELCYAVGQLGQLVSRVHGRDPVYSGEVPGYVAAAAHTQSWGVLPHALAFAQPMLDHLSGMRPGTRRWLEHREGLRATREVVSALAGTALDVGALDALAADHASGERGEVTRILGAQLYDPTRAEPA